MLVRKIKYTTEDIILNILIYTIITIISIAMLYPFFNVIAVSLSTYKSYILNPMMFFPTDFDFTAFRYIFQNKLIAQSYLNTTFITGVGTILGLILISMTAYPLSRTGLRGKKGFIIFYLIVMLFPGGMIPSFVVIKSIGLYDSLWSLIIPTLCPIYNLILMKSFFESIPQSLIEAAKIDGASEMYIFRRIVIPLSKPVLAAIALFLGVAYWNEYFSAVLFIKSQNKWPLQLLVREIVTNIGPRNELVDPNEIYPISIKYASIIVVLLPVLAIYPFIQKYFVKGVMIGAVKG